MTTAGQTQVLIDRVTRVPQPIPDPFRTSIASVEP
jgi:acyl-CoA thioesterase FadM